MAPANRYRQLPSGGRTVGFELEAPPEVEIQPGETTVRVRQERDGKPVGELEVSVFQAALLIDRDGVLEGKAGQVARSITEPGARIATPEAVSLPGASGFRTDAEVVRPMGAARPPLPYVYVFAIAPHDLAINGGVVLTVRCAERHWPAADAVLRSLRLLGRGGKPIADASSSTLTLPVIGQRED